MNGAAPLRAALDAALRADARGVSTREGSTAGQPLKTTTSWSMSIQTALPEARATPPTP